MIITDSTLLPAAAHAKDEQFLFDIAVVLASPEGKDRFDDTIRFYWSGQTAPTATLLVKVACQQAAGVRPQI